MIRVLVVVLMVVIMSDILMFSMSVDIVCGVVMID